jgi:hypothetical protein
MANKLFEYDVALSFAREDREVAEELAEMLRARNRKVLLDESQSVELGGGDFTTHIAELYRTKARYCVVLLSRHYPLKAWRESERTSVQQRSLRDANEYILPLQLDDTEVPGSQEIKGYTDLRRSSLEAVVDLLEGKLADVTSRPGPPSESHDLRSGNVPSTQE